MRALLYLWCLFLPTSFSFGFAEPTSLANQVKRADTILRVVVISATEIEDSSEFRSLAKCRIISKYKGGADLHDFVHIPIDWTVDPQPSIDIGGDYIITMEALKSVSIAHPIFWDSAHKFSGGKILYKKFSKEQVLNIAEFEKILRDLVGVKEKSAESLPE